VATDLAEVGAELQTQRGWLLFAATAEKRPRANCGRPVCMAHVTPEQMASCDCLTCHGFWAASTSPEKLARQLRAVGPDATLALRTGLDSKVLVMDLDPKPGRGLDKLIPFVRPLVRGAGMLPTAKTPRGGRHFYFRLDEIVPSSVGRIGEGVDIRAEGGLVVLPPSAGREWTEYGLPDGPLPSTPQALIEAARPRQQGDAVPRPGSQRGNLDSLARYVAQAGDGERNVILHWAARRAADLVLTDKITMEAALDELVSAAMHAGLSQREATRTVHAALRRGGAS
jgi:hypothetical protein